MLSRVAVLLTTLIAVRVLAPGEFGLYVSLYAVALIAAAIWDLGLSVVVSRGVGGGRFSARTALARGVRLRVLALPVWIAALAAGLALASKLTSYFAPARPVVAAVSPSSETAREIERARAGVLVSPDQPEALLEAVVRLQREPERARGRGENGGTYAQTELRRSEGLRAYDAFVSRLIPGGGR